MITNGECVRIQKQLVMVHLRLLSWHSSEGSEENHKRYIRIACNLDKVWIGNLKQV
jgi:hypothetical protein